MSLQASSHFARDLARLLASWLACIVFVQAMASALALAQGPRHLHVHPVDLAHAAEHHTHDGWATHVHVSPADATLHDDAQELGAAAGLVLSAMVAIGPLRDGSRAAHIGHVMRASTAWSCITHAAPFPDRPPRG